MIHTIDGGRVLAMRGYWPASASASSIGIGIRHARP
jgi:hypothetical protein